ncbi:MAG: hypothetical protein M1840_004328 [Geoglossum simile]|nr:MAG: hypothetical protein M1840_004328 [Geoglossum simile]
MEFQNIHGGIELRPELCTTHPELSSILGDYTWIHGNIGGDGGLTLRTPGGATGSPSKVTGEITFAEGGCAAWANINDFIPCLDDEGKGYWWIGVDEWIFGNGNGDETSPRLQGHQLATTTEEDDNGNPYIVFTMNEGLGSEGPYSFMIGKKRCGGRGCTKGDKQRLGLRHDPDTQNEGTQDNEGRLLSVEKPTYDNKGELGLEGMELQDCQDISSLLGTYRWIYNSEDRDPWHPYDPWDGGLTLTRSPRGHKITGRLSFWGRGANNTTTVAGLSPGVSEDDNRSIWSLATRKWSVQAEAALMLQTRSSDGGDISQDAHQLSISSVKDENQNPFAVLKIHWAGDYAHPPHYSYLIGKRQRGEYGRLGFSARELVGLIYGKERVWADGRGELVREVSPGQWVQLLNPMAGFSGVGRGWVGADRRGSENEDARRAFGDV